ncbi:MAG: putative nucleotidyltransferase substrate binding domain-containing protein [Hydrogenophilus sp.]
MSPSQQHNILFDPLARWCTLGLKTCAADDTAMAVAQQMEAQGVSSLIVEKAGKAVGIVTDRDLRNKVVARGLAPESVTAESIMGAPLVSLPRHAPLHAALLEMARRGIHRLVVCDEADNPIGILSQSDVLKTQRHSPHLMALEIEKATALETLKELQQTLQELVAILVRTHTPIQETVALIAYLNDALARRVVEITAESVGLGVDRFAFVVLGSQGRGEQTLATDQDNALVLADDLDETEVALAQTLGERISEGLLAIGFPPCPGNIMTRNPFWRRGAQAWQEQIAAWVERPTPEHVLNAAMFADIRTLAGNDTLTQQLVQRFYTEAARDNLFFARMAQNTVRFAVPLGWLGRIKTKPSGAIKAGVDLKKAGIFAITDGIRTLALRHQALTGNTFARIEKLKEKGVLPEHEGKELRSALAFLLDLRLRAQLDAIDAGMPPSNVIDLKALTRLERAELIAALRTVERFQAFIRMHFKLDLLRN